MGTKIHQGFLQNKGAMRNTDEKYSEIWTAREGEFDSGFTVMQMDDLHTGVEGNDLLLDVNLKALTPYKEELEKGSKVNVYLEWELNEDRTDYNYARVQKVEVIEKTTE